MATQAVATEAAGGFAGGYAEVRLNNGSGIIDRSGRLVIPARFEPIIPFSKTSFVALPLREGGAPRAGADMRLNGFPDDVFYGPEPAAFIISAGDG